MDPLKNMFNKKAIAKISKEIKLNYKKFDDKNFKKDIFKELDHLELKQRTRHIAVTLHDYLPNDFEKAAKIIVKSLADENKKDDMDWDRYTNKGIVGFLVWPLNEYVEIYGLDHYDTSMWAMYELTKRFTSEFTVRTFIEEYDERVYKDLRKWIKDPNRHVRRWISEGTRPTLPWAMNVKKIHNNIPRNIPILKALFQDKEAIFVRKDHPLLTKKKLGLSDQLKSQEQYPLLRVTPEHSRHNSVLSDHVNSQEDAMESQLVGRDVYDVDSLFASIDMLKMTDAVMPYSQKMCAWMKEREIETLLVNEERLGNVGIYTKQGIDDQKIQRFVQILQESI